MKTPPEPETRRNARRLSKIAAIGGCRCPRCRHGHMFPYRAYHLRGFARMHPECPHCGQDFRIEPGFYMMASYIGYVNMVVLIVVLSFSAFAWLPQQQDWITIAVCIGLTTLLIPFNFRLSRSLNLHLFGGVRYHPGAGRERTGFYVDADGSLRDGGPREEYRPDSR